MLATPVAVRTAPRQGPASLFRSAVSLVALNVTVQDAKSQYVTGLRPEDFVIYEDGVRQEVRFFEASSIPIDLIVLLDTSWSMADKLDAARSAARGFLGTLRPGDRGAVVTFNHAVDVKVPLTCDHAALDGAIRATVAGGNTAVHTALYIALKQFGLSVRTEGAAARRQAIAVLSDGEDTSSLVASDDVLALARQMGVNVYTVRLRSVDPIRDGDLRTQKVASEADYEMKTLARETGALSFFPAGPEQLPSVYASIAKEIANQYSIGYEPVRASGEGGLRRVQVQVINHPELRARTRTGYTAEPVRVLTTAQR
jgi:VWFA-related protein